MGIDCVLFQVDDLERFSMEKWWSAIELSDLNEWVLLCEMAVAEVAVTAVRVFIWRGASNWILSRHDFVLFFIVITIVGIADVVAGWRFLFRQKLSFH